MLEGEGNSILDSFERRITMRTSETLRDDDPDPAVHVFGIPTALLQDLRVKWREAQEVLVAVSIDVYAESQSFALMARGRRGEAYES
jgi:hypothetical protein